jgi:hypothetical protein
MSKSKVIVAYLGQPHIEFYGDSIKSNQYGIKVYENGKMIGFAGERRGRLPTHAYLVKPKKWKLKFIKE